MSLYEESLVHTEPALKLVVVAGCLSAWKLITSLVRESSKPKALPHEVIVMKFAVLKYPRPSTAML